MFEVQHKAVLPESRVDEMLIWLLANFDFDRGRIFCRDTKTTLTREMIDCNLEISGLMNEVPVSWNHTLLFSDPDQGVLYKLLFVA